MDERFAPLYARPCYVVIFTSQLSDDTAGYERMAARMAELATGQPGYIGAESVRDSNGFGITVSYWRDADALAAWKRNVEHLAAQELGKARWYRHYALRVCKVERACCGPGKD